ncbi:MAG TPA: hypothetical protein VEY92_12350 [Pseudoxanthomonas sp.]|nr:hypothetical protein [Pseudoxanthomonas sp.]
MGPQKTGATGNHRTPARPFALTVRSIHKVPPVVGEISAEFITRRIQLAEVRKIDANSREQLLDQHQPPNGVNTKAGGKKRANCFPKNFMPREKFS